MKWYNPQCEPFVISGFPFYKQDMVYRRMPLNPSRPLPDAVYRLADETAGGQIRFHAKLKTLRIQVYLSSKKLFYDKIRNPHIANITKFGFDFYASKDGGDYEYIGVAMQIGFGRTYDENDGYYEHTFLEGTEEVEIDVLLNFPLYGAVDKVLIGVDDDAEISSPHKTLQDERNIVLYGGSIQQGACASRPGMCDSNILSRWLGHEVFNLGFNGSAKAEDEVAEVIAGIEQTAALVISTEGNCPDGKWIEEHLARFIDIYREKHPVTPIIIMPFPKKGVENLLAEKKALRDEKFNAQVKVVDSFKAKGDENIHLLIQNDYIEEEYDGHSVWHEFFSDGLHKTDVGFLSTAKGLYEVLKKYI